MVQYHGLKLLEGHLMLMVHLVFVHDLLDLRRCQLVAKFSEGVTKRRSGNLILTGRIEPTEKRVQSLRRRVLVHWESGSDEFMVVDHTRAIDIYLGEDALEFIFTQVSVALANSIAQLVDLDCT